jgi:hypothetical protein
MLIRRFALAVAVAASMPPALAQSPPAPQQAPATTPLRRVTGIGASAAGRPSSGRMQDR